MFSRRYYSDNGRGGRIRDQRMYGYGYPNNASSQYFEEQRNQLLQHIYRSRGIYESIVSNMRREDELLSNALPSSLGGVFSYGMNGNVSRNDTGTYNQTTANSEQNATNPINTNNRTQNETQNNRNTYIHPERQPYFSVSPFNMGGVQRVRSDSNTSNPFQNIFMDLSNLLFNGSNIFGDVTNGNLGGMTNERISVAVRDAIYRDLDDDIRERYTTCPITLDQFEDDMQVGVLRACGHVFRREAIYNWLSTRHTCPSCRRNLNEPVAPDTTSGNTTETVPNRNTNNAMVSDNVDNVSVSQHNETTETHSQSQQSSLPSHYGTVPVSNNVNGVFGTHLPSLLINPTVRSTHTTDNGIDMEFEGVIGVPSNIGDDDAQHRHIMSILERMFDEVGNQGEISVNLFGFPQRDASGNSNNFSISESNRATTEEEYQRVANEWRQTDASGNW